MPSPPTPQQSIARAMTPSISVCAWLRWAADRRARGEPVVR
jgi:hypothetical protein